MHSRHAEVLIVDDEADVCWALTHVLERIGIVPVATRTGQDALGLATGHRFRLIFVDAKLPDFDGIDLARRLRAAEPGVPIVLISGYFYRDDAEVRQAVEAGTISAFVGKPFQHEEIRKIATQMLA